MSYTLSQKGHKAYIVPSTGDKRLNSTSLPDIWFRWSGILLLHNVMNQNSSHRGQTIEKGSCYTFSLRGPYAYIVPSTRYKRCNWSALASIWLRWSGMFYYVKLCSDITIIEVIEKDSCNTPPDKGLMFAFSTHLGLYLTVRLPGMLLSCAVIKHSRPSESNTSQGSSVIPFIYRG